MSKCFAGIMFFGLVLGLGAPSAQGEGCVGDVTGNGFVSGADLGTLLAYWGPRTFDPASSASDLDGSGVVDGADLGMLLANWGPCPSTVTAIDPTTGCVGGGTKIKISGNYLGSASSVTIGGIPATDLTVSGLTSITVTTPPGVLGPANIRVATASGTVEAPQTFSYLSVSMTSVVPNQGTVAGGWPIVIYGGCLARTTSISIGGLPATNVTVLNDTTVTATTPSGSLGPADVVISSGDGEVRKAGAFNYVSAVVPAWGTLVEALPDPAVVTDPNLRAAISATGLPWRVRDTATQIEMLLIPPGTFEMGCIMRSTRWPCYLQEQPVHQVRLVKPFYIGRYEVTQAQWTAVYGSNPSYWVGKEDSAVRPVEQVSWNRTQVFLSASGFRLPSEAEWEFACRAGTVTPFYNGSQDDTTAADLAWYNGNALETHPVGGKLPNGFGLYDMLGNVMEWVSDWYSPYSPSNQLDPLGPSVGDLKVMRGGSWIRNTATARSSSRLTMAPDHFESPGNNGFRVARDP